MSNPPQQVNDKNLLKIEVLKKGLLDERKKRSEIESEVIKLKEEVVIKQETIDKLKEELLKLRDKSSKKQIQRFISGFFEEEEEQPKTNDEEKLLQKENEELKEKISSLENEKNFINSKLSESVTEYNNLRNKYEDQIAEIQKEKDEKIAKIQQDYEIKNQNLLKQIFDKNQTISEQSKSIKCMSELYKSFDMQKFDYEKEISSLKKQVEEYKKTFDVKSNEVDILLKEQNQLLKQIEEDKDEIFQLKDEIKQYKIIIEDLTPISIDYLFQGYLIPTEKNTKKRRIEISFGKYQHSLYFKEENEKEKIFVNKEISDIVYDKKSNNRVWICVFAQGAQKNYLCEFTRKETEYIIKFYKGIKVKPNLVENALMNVSLGDYFY